MTPAAILNEAQAAGVALWREGEVLRYRGPRVALTKLLPTLKAHKAELLEALQNVDAEGAEDLREHFEERAGILEYDAGLPRAQAELEAARITVTYARNCCCQWASLRVALSAYPELLASLPEKVGPVDSLPLGVSKVAVLSGRRVLRQGVFTGEHVLSGNTERNP